MSSHEPDQPQLPSDGRQRPLPVMVGVICTVLIALECVVVGVIFVVFVRQYVPDATAAMSMSADDVATLRTGIVIAGVIGIVVAALLVIGAIRMLAASRAWRNTVIIVLVLNALFPNALSVATHNLAIVLLVLVDIVGIVCLAVGSSAQWFARTELVNAARSGPAGGRGTV